MGVRQLPARKPLADLHGESSGLKRVIGPVGLTAVGIGAIIGSGIFVTTGEVAARHAGPGVILSYVVAGLACALAALCYAEFARWPRRPAARTATPTPPSASWSPGSSAGTWSWSTPPPGRSSPAAGPATWTSSSGRSPGPASTRG